MPSPCVVTGNLATLLGGNAAYGYVEFVLGNLGTGTVPRVLGTGIFPALKQVVQTDENGNISAEIWGNDQIDPANTIYLVTFRDSQRNEVGQVQFYINGSSFNLNTAVAASTVFPPVLFQAGNINRFLTTLGTPLTSAAFTFSGWGAGATITNINGTDTAVSFTITAGTTPSVRPTVTLSYHDGSWGGAPLILSEMTGGTGDISDVTSSASPTGVTITYGGLPLNGQTYTFIIVSIGDSPNNAPNTSPVFTGMVILNPTGTQTIVQPAATNLNVNRFENIRFADQFPGADMGIKINAADADLGTSPGEIWVTNYNGQSTATQVIITNGHVLRFIQGGTFGWTAGGIILTQGSSIIGSGGMATGTTNATGTVLYHNFNGDFITMNGAPTSGGNQGGNMLDNLTLFNTYSGGDLSGNAIIIKPQASTGVVSWAMIRRVFVDGANASFRWTRGLYGTDSLHNAFFRDLYVETSRFSSSGTNNEDVRLEGIQNCQFTNVRSDNSNNGAQTVGWTITGGGGASATSADVSIVDGNSQNLVLDHVTNISVEGGFYNTITTTANLLGANTIRPGFITTGPIVNNSPSTTVIFDPSTPGAETVLGTLSGTLGKYAQVIASGTATMTTAAIGSGAVGTTVTVAATGVLTTDAIAFSFNAAPAANPAELVISAWPTANNVNFQYANPTAGSVTPAAATLNWRVVR